MGPIESNALSDRAVHVRSSRHLEYGTIAFTVLEAAVATVSGVSAGSIALIGFGLDSVIEVASAGALLWRLHADMDPEMRERREKTALRIVGICFLALAAYVSADAVKALVTAEAPHESIPGILLAAVALIVMPLLARKKRLLAAVLNSGALAADSRQADFCAYLAGILLVGLTLNAVFGLWWADPVAGLIMVPIIVREGWSALLGKTCADSCGH
jgi:divalent metal cation (Fe/Co/Zn/Cd) transporter